MATNTLNVSSTVILHSGSLIQSQVILTGMTCKAPLYVEAHSLDMFFCWTLFWETDGRQPLGMLHLHRDKQHPAVYHKALGQLCVVAEFKSKTFEYI